MLTAGTLPACWPIGLVFVRPGLAGLLVSITSPRTGIAIAGLLLLATPLLLPRHDRTPQPARELARSQAG